MLQSNISLCFIIAVLTNAVIGPRNFNREDTDVVLAELNKIKQLDMGFLEEFVMRERRVKHNSEYERLIDYLNNHIEHIYQQLECSYALFAMRYMRLIGAILADPMDLVKEDVLEKVLFDDEAAAMLATSIDMPKINAVKNTMWAFWLFADRLHRFLDETKKFGTVDEENHSAILAAHRNVSDVLDRFLNRDQCVFHKAESKSNNLAQLIDELNVPDKSKQLVWYLRNNKNVFDRQKSDNADFGVNTFRQQRISMTTLNLDGLLGIQTFVVHSKGAEFWQTIESKLSDVYNTAMELGTTLTQQTESVCIFQKELTDIAKKVSLGVDIKIFESFKEYTSSEECQRVAELDNI
ncbi:uncharacterized protein LOC126842459 [Adelges cooleyi]|uniref:uncharacterized protein LOC126842459 n=1 Tax=Adelges cooleyi TaxID=133065 RepID=UPI00217F4988|nr:uncharacterized protein LOC126842459 [Adelges cooleyi]